VYKVWNIPPIGTAEYDYLNLVTDVLAVGKTSRLYKRLVYDDQITTDVRAFVRPREIGGQLQIQATARPGQDLGEVEQAIDEELARFLADGPTAEEMERVQTEYRASFVRGIERIGGFGGKSDILASSEVYGDSPDAYKTILARTAAATAVDLRTAAVDWLSDGVYILEVHPFPQYDLLADGVDRSQLPYPDDIPAAKFPLLLDAGYAADRSAAVGTASLTMSMLDEGTTSRNALQISDELRRLGATLSSGSSLDISTVTMTALSDKLDESLALYADVIQNPAFAQAELDRLKAETVARIQREMTQPVQMGLRILPALLYDEGHAYNIPLTGSGTIETVSAMTRDDLATFHQAWFKPNNATLVVVGDVTMEALRPALERQLGGWVAGDAPAKPIGDVARETASEIYILDRPGAQQSVIFAAHLVPPKANENEIAHETMNLILGGSFTSRINMNLREDKHWSYGSRSFVFDARGPRILSGYAPVQTDKTMESMIELAKEFSGIQGEIPVTTEELDKAKARRTLRLPGQWETNAAVAGSVATIVQFGLGDDYWDTLAGKVRALSTADIEGSATEIVHPDRLVWVVVGDREKIEPGIRQLGWGPVRVIDPEGNVIEGGPAAR
jgi:zinc protease